MSCKNSKIINDLHKMLFLFLSFIEIWGKVNLFDLNEIRSLRANLIRWHLKISPEIHTAVNYGEKYRCTSLGSKWKAISAHLNMGFAGCLHGLNAFFFRSWRIKQRWWIAALKLSNISNSFNKAIWAIKHLGPFLSFVTIRSIR